MRQSGDPESQWRGNARLAAHFTTPLPTSIDPAPLPTPPIGTKLGKNIEQDEYYGSLANQGAAAP